MNTTPYQWPVPKPFLNEIKVLPEHTDQLGHTNNVRYLEWLENIAWEHVAELGCPWSLMKTLGKAMAITRTQMHYRLASYAGDTLLLGTWVSASDSRLSCSRAFEMVRTSDHKCVLKAEMDFACISLDSGRACRMPREFAVALEKGLLNTPLAPAST